MFDLHTEDDVINVELLFSKGKEGTHIHGSLSSIIKSFVRIVSNLLVLSECPIDLEIVANESEVAGVGEVLTNSRRESEIKLAEILEDELLMSVPMIPRHPQVRCPDNDYEQQNVKTLFGGT